MEDELEEKVLHQACMSQMKFLSKFSFNAVTFFNRSSGFTNFMRFLLRPEVLFFAILIFVVCFYLQALELNTIGFVSRISRSFNFGSRPKISFAVTTAVDGDTWDDVKVQSAVYAIQGRRPKMEDRFVVEENINGSTGISMFAIFDGHGGEFAAEFCRSILVQNLYNKIIETVQILKNNKKTQPKTDEENDRFDLNCGGADGDDDRLDNLVQRKPSFKRTADDSRKTNNQIDSDILGKLKPKDGGYFKKNVAGTQNEPQPPPKTFDAKCYVQHGKAVNYGKMITDEVLYADYNLVEKAKKQTNFAGSTALIALLEGTKLIVANVGDSRGVMCDSRGNAIPLSFDHKPQSAKEHKRIQEAGGFIAFKGVWRVSGILATSRALGDYPLKPNLVIADPDILTFELADHKPQFLILASDGLWDTFTNEEAVAFIREHIKEPHFGAKSITLQSYARGSVDNISTIVIVFKNGIYQIGSSKDD